MAEIREFALDDLFKINTVVFDPLTEIYTLPFIMGKLLKFPDLSNVVVAPNGQIKGFVYGERLDNDKKMEIDGRHGHISSLAIAYDYRRLGLGTRLMNEFTTRLEQQSDHYADLYVRERNMPAIHLYESLGYVKRRWVPFLYNDDNGYVMRKPLRRDVLRKGLKRGWKSGISFKARSIFRFIHWLVLLWFIGLRDWVFDFVAPHFSAINYLR